MKVFIVALLALPAALAAPLAGAAPIDSLKCACANAAGQTRSSGLCHLMVGALDNPGEWCYRGTSYAPAMETVFTATKCAEQWGAEWNRSICKPIKLCPRAPGVDAYSPC
ncbi:hypothetical protein GQ44DRAFT_775511 [Phaeosphaeriaceae sp. PMI808]|nr:hypothetical protein GQ44DRAFT_775511 [Phaeosphaeriaceae sp. PMI808]